ncbi:4-(cytidine 5'-diphospho)-2-C-methyl-D-erythritol kinase [Kocuria tytonis]|uniref:4-diphosphocytidyl-2-C-methyl-D-erythritol kinase n=1 Tax=Kocuria tytonis TaxID=2054280 RepID=A0A495A3U0_9MICC|nr:4-(cytidine 5'-diphospho)-2-C-methyl-D-erythritol kinase [Kocuria tytonis]RKQ34157.1 4-(cytidine 5'-diphospho)-2-C-methyl-D-erythritol kinase [Kocuria tytonis]
MTAACRRVTASAPAKTNLVLHVGSPSPDGYHPLETLFVAVDLRETVTVTLDPALARRDAGITVTVEPAPGSEYARMVAEGSARLADVPLDAGNLAVRAALAVCEAFGAPVPGLRVHLRKAVPVAGGMGGGSADAAAALVAVNDLLAGHLGAAPLPAERLARLGAALGADVPFMLLGGAAIGRGTGTELTAVPGPSGLHFVFVPQDQGLSTPAVYRQWDAEHTVANAASGTGSAPDPVPAEALEALAVGDPERLAARVRNDLQAPAIRLLPELEGLLNHGVDLGALAGWVSGSGPTLCFLAASGTAARNLAGQFAHERRHALAVAGPVPGARVEARG